MKRFFIIILSLSFVTTVNQSFAARSVNLWTWTEAYQAFGGAPFGIWGLLPYYEENGQTWMVLGLYSYDNGTKALSAAIEYNTPEVLTMDLSGGFENFWAERLRRVGINSSVTLLSGLSGRMRSYNYCIAKIEKNQIEKLRTLTTSLDKFESMKFSDFYNMACGSMVSGQSFVECTVVGVKRIFLSEFINCFLADPGNKEHVTKNMFGVQVQSVQPQPTSKSAAPASTQQTTNALQTALHELSVRLNELSAKI